MTKVKICGIRSIREIDICNKYEPDFIGFVFVKDRRRYISKENALRLKKYLNKSIMSVGVFLNNPIEEVIDIANSGAIDMVQLHGCEGENYIRDLRKRINIPVIKAYKDFVDCDYALFDNPKPGEGQIFDWNTIDSKNKEYFLAGGISKENVLDALALHPYAVDASSSLEGPDGYKDEMKVKEFIRLVRNYEG